MALNRSQMIAIINGGGSVLVGDVLYSNVNLVPSDAQISSILNMSSPNAGGLPVSGVLNATTAGAPLSAIPVFCKEVIVFSSEAAADTFIGDANSQNSRIPSLPITIPVDDVSKIWGRLSIGTGDITWLAIV